MSDLFGNEIIRTLGLYQPYATLMLPPYNKVETRWVRRNKKPPFPLGKYLIYATKKQYTAFEFESIAGKRLAHQANKLLFQHGDKNLWIGHAIGVGELYKIEEMTNRLDDRAFVESFAGDSAHQMWALHFKDMKRINPFKFKGKQGVGILPKEQHHLIELL